MDDTPLEIKKKVCEMIREKSPTERVMMGCSMYATSRYLVIRAILEEYPDISPARLRQELFLRFYRDDFDPIEREKILQHLGQISTDLKY